MLLVRLPGGVKPVLPGAAPPCAPLHQFLGSAHAVLASDARSKHRRWLFDKSDLAVLRVPVGEPATHSGPDVPKSALYVYVELNTSFALTEDELDPAR